MKENEYTTVLGFKNGGTREIEVLSERFDVEVNVVVNMLMGTPSQTPTAKALRMAAKEMGAVTVDVKQRIDNNGVAWRLKMPGDRAKELAKELAVSRSLVFGALAWRLRTSDAAKRIRTAAVEKYGAEWAPQI